MPRILLSSVMLFTLFFIAEAKEKLSEVHTNAVINISPVSRIAEIKRISLISFDDNTFSVISPIQELEEEHLKQVSPIEKINDGLSSRFDAYNPSYFSRCWAIKLKAVKYEEEGKNTDDLWKLYWDLIGKDGEK